MRKFLRGVGRLSNWVMVLPIVVFFYLALWLPQNRLAIITNGLVIGVWIPLVRNYLPPFWKNLRSDKSHPETYFLGGILLGSTAIAMSRIWSLGIIMAGKPAWMINHWFQSFCYLLAALSWYYLLRVPENKKSARYITYALITAVSVIVVGLLYLEN